MGYDRQEIYRKAEAFRAARKYRKALKEYLRIIEVDPEDHQVIARLADIYRLLGNKHEAISYYEKAADHSFNDDRLDKAAPIYRQLIELDPKTLRRYQDLGDVFVARKRAGDAVQLYKDGVRAMGGSKFLADRIELQERILELDANEFGVRLHLAKNLGKSGDDKRALVLLQEGLRLMQGRRRRKWRRKYKWAQFRIRPSLSGFFKYLFGR